MSDTKPKIDLDAALAAWPEGKSIDVVAPLTAVASSSRVPRSAGEPSDDALFAAPFEGENDFVPPSTVARERDRQNLRDLAKLAVELSPTTPKVVVRAAEAKDTDSGIIDLAAAAKADPEAGIRARTTELAAEGLFDEPPASARPPASIPHIPASVPSIPIVALSSRRIVEDAAPASVRESSHRAPKRGVPLYLAGVVALGAAAAAFFFLMKGSPSSPVAQVTTTQVPPAIVATAAPAASTAEPAASASSLPATSVAMLEPVPAPSAKAPPKPAADEAPVAAKPKAEPADLDTELRKAMGDESKNPPVPASGSKGSAGMGDVPQQPAQGQIAGALSMVLPEARSCLGPDDPIARATLVFASDGTVQSVVVTPEGSAAEPCIKLALSRAKVPPFAKPTFSASTNIRHN